MSLRDLNEKKEGGYFTGLPLVDSDSDTGFGFGARLYYYWDATRQDPLFGYTPYRHRIFAQIFATTKGYQYHALNYDAPYAFNGPVRFRAALYYERNTAANYFGRGASTLGDLSFTGARRTFGSFDAYTAGLRQISPLGATHTLYNKFDFEDPGLSASVETDFLGGIARAQVGFAASYVLLGDYTGAHTVADDPVSGRTDVSATMAPTRLHEDCAAARIAGCGGGLHNILKLGVALDTRDFEPAPNSGLFIDITAELSSRYIGSDYDYARVTVAPRAFFSPLPKRAHLVLAGRVAYSIQTDGVPFFAMNNLAFTDGDHQGLGGLWTLRGYRQDRFVGRVAALANFEVRWSFVHFDALGQHFALAAVPFLDIGRVFDQPQDFTFAHWRRGEGGGLRVVWNEATVVVLDYGFSEEDSGLYMDFGYQF